MFLNQDRDLEKTCEDLRIKINSSNTHLPKVLKMPESYRRKSPLPSTALIRKSKSAFNLRRIKAQAQIHETHPHPQSKEQTPTHLHTSTTPLKARSRDKTPYKKQQNSHSPPNLHKLSIAKTLPYNATQPLHSLSKTQTLSNMFSNQLSFLEDDPDKAAKHSPHKLPKYNQSSKDAPNKQRKQSKHTHTHTLDSHSKINQRNNAATNDSATQDLILDSGFAEDAKVNRQNYNPLRGLRASQSERKLNTNIRMPKNSMFGTQSKVLSERKRLRFVEKHRSSSISRLSSFKLQNKPLFYPLKNSLYRNPQDYNKYGFPPNTRVLPDHFSFYTVIQNEKAKETINSELSVLKQDEEREMAFYKKVKAPTAREFYNQYRQVMLKIKNIKLGDRTIKSKFTLNLDIIELQENILKKVTVLEDDYKYYKIESENKFPPFRIFIDKTEGRFLIYLSRQTEKPGPKQNEGHFTSEEFSFAPTNLKFKSPFIYLSMKGITHCQLNIICRFNTTSSLSLTKKKQKGKIQAKGEIRNLEIILRSLRDDPVFRKDYLFKTGFWTFFSN